jgi:hypothetical protein
VNCYDKTPAYLHKLFGGKVSYVEKFHTWRDLLGILIQDVHEKQRIAQALGVNAITLSRWVGKSSTPRPIHLRHLMTVIPPQYRSTMLDLIRQEFPTFSFADEETMKEDDQDEIPSEFYARIFNAYSATPALQRSWSVMSLTLQQMLGQLDPLQVGMAVTIAQCMPPSIDGKVCSLRERTGYGTPPWGINLESYAVFLGAESLAGYAVSSCHPRIIQNSEEQQGVLPAHWVQWERSAAAYPIFRSDRVAGCLLVSCTQPDYFTPARQKLIQQYSELLVLVFEAHEFYAMNDINLHVLPYYRLQAKYLANFRQRVSDVMMEELRKGHAIDLRQAELLVWKQVEQELWQLPPYTGKPDDAELGDG